MRQGRTHCVDCGAPKGRRDVMTQRCETCRPLFDAAMRKAIDVVYRAVRSGVLPKAKTLTCVDCSKPAEHWDHRDYRKPLVVEAVCRVCNFNRGPALWREAV